jgi:peptide/nickel transport system permease protein
MYRYIIRRIIEMVPLVLAIAVVNFIIIHIAPGDPALLLAGEQASPEYVAQVRQEFALDRPLYEQLLAYLGRLVRGDLGRSLLSNRPVWDTIIERIPATVVLVYSCDLTAFVVGTLLGALAARHHGKAQDKFLIAGSLFWYSVPLFLSGIFYITVFAVVLRWLPTSGMTSYTAPRAGFGHIIDVLRHFLLPYITLLGARIPPYLRVSRSSTFDIMNEDFIRTLRAAGVPENRIFIRHALRNALLPMVTMYGLWMGISLSGALLTETVFAWPGMGRLMYEAISYRDYPIIMGCFIIVSIWVIVMSLVTDIVYAYLDPRITYT